MAEMNVKGSLFNSISTFVVRMWGLPKIKDLMDEYRVYLPEKWYPFEDYIELLYTLDTDFGSGDGSTVYKLGRDMIKSDQRWKNIFGGQDPAEVFMTSKRQRSQYQGGEFLPESQGQRHISLTMTGWPCRGIWCEFYRGNVQGVLDLTGYQGKVTKRACSHSGDKACIFDIEWE